MRYRELGQTGLSVSELCLGTWELSGAWGQDVEPAVQAVRRAFDRGVTFFDTAYAYGEGLAEQGLARGLGDLLRSRRDELVIVTKGGVETTSSAGKTRIVRNSDASFLRKCLEQSLRLLGLDYVDVYLIHWPDPTVPFAETAGVVDSFVAEGLTRHGGVSNYSLQQLREAEQGGRVSVYQGQFNLLIRPGEHDLLPACREKGIGIMGYAALARGVLSGTLRRGQQFPADDWRSSNPAFRGAEFERLLDAVDAIAEVAASHSCTTAQLALAWVMRHPLGIVPIIGAQRPEHVDDSLGATEFDLSPEDVAALSALEFDIPPFGSADIMVRTGT